MGLGEGNSLVEVAALLPQLELARSITLVLANFEHGDNHCLYRQRRFAATGGLVQPLQRWGDALGMDLVITRFG